MRVLILAHGHAELIAGGAEQAALALHRRLKAVGGVDPILIARAPVAAIGHDAVFGAFRGRADELLAAPPGEDPFTFESLRLSVLERMVVDLVERFRPDLVHFQHFAGWSIDAVTLFARAGVPVVMSLHEYLLICNRDGQMVKTDGRLCHAESPGECAGCFPRHSAGAFYLRKAMLQDRLAPVARFVSPSRFLADRFVAWGLDERRVSVIENPLSPDLLAQGEADDPKPVRAPGDPLSIAFFGQINPYKGVDILLVAAALLPRTVRDRVSIDIHGGNLAPDRGAFNTALGELAHAARKTARLRGPYQNTDVVAMMRGADWIVVPSIWWENAPVVMQEAQVAGRPILASAIGGMAEKIGSGVPGRLFRPGDPRALADAIAGIVLDPAPPPPAMRFTEAGRLEAYLDVYASAIRR